MGWFYQGERNFVAFSELIQDMPNSVYKSEFVSALLDENWDDLKHEITWKHFSIYFAYAVCSIIYMKLAIASRGSEDSIGGSPGMICLLVVTALLWLQQLYVEIKQLVKVAKEDGICAYFITSGWNLLDLFGLIIVFFVLLETVIQSN
jgi:hypothetical protein